MPKAKRPILVEDKEEKSKLADQLRSAGPRFSMLLKLTREVAPRFLPLIVLNALVRSAQIGLAVFIPKFFIDAVTRNLPWSEALKLIIFAAAAEGLLRLVSQLLTRVLDVEDNRVYHGMNKALAEKITRLPYSNLEDPEILTLKEEAGFVMTNQGAAQNFVFQLREIVQQSVTIITLVSILSRLSLLLLLFLILIVVIIALLQSSIKRYETRFFLNLVGVNRKYGYYINNAYNAEHQQQIRLYGLDAMLTERVEEMNLELCDYLAEYFLKIGRVAGLQSILTDLQVAVVYGYTTIRVLTNLAGARITLGSFSLYAGASIQFTSAMRAILTALRDIKQIMDYLAPFETFMKLPERGASVNTSEVAMADRKFALIEFDNVSFTYPGTEKPVLENVSFSIQKGEKISVVGLNGAGKTTLVKLLCRFFKPDSGRILVNGRDIQSWPENEYLAEIAAVFQDFRLLPFSIKSNISSKSDEEISGEELRRLEAISRESSVASFVEKLEEGMSTLLNKSINRDGTELSGGQAQKVAIARALFKGASLVILDEPTSALDPLAEAEIYEHFDTLVHGQTAIYISHRMSSSRFCDKVLVLDGGKVADFAHHDELIQNKDSLYSRLFDEQKKYYSLA